MNCDRCGDTTTTRPVELPLETARRVHTLLGHAAEVAHALAYLQVEGTAPLIELQLALAAARRELEAALTRSAD